MKAKKILLIIALTLQVTSLALYFPLSAMADQGNKNVKEVNFKVEGMTCGLCPISVTTALKKLDGVIDAKASYEEKSAWAKYDEKKIDVSKMIEAINGLGFKASLKK